VTAASGPAPIGTFLTILAVEADRVLVGQPASNTWWHVDPEPDAPALRVGERVRVVETTPVALIVERWDEDGPIQAEDRCPYRYLLEAAPGA
jgi:hypothetical protein